MRTFRYFCVLVTAGIVVTSCAGEKQTTEQNIAAGTLVIGIKYDQPGLSLRKPNGSVTGFDVDVARYVATRLGVPAAGIRFQEAPSTQRETLLQNGQVDYIVGSYSITDKRKKKVDFAGPYFIAGQSLLVRRDDTGIAGVQSLSGGKKLCSVKGSTSASTIKTKYAHDVQLQEYDTYSLCVEALRYGAIDAVTTDDIILAGFVEQSPDTLRLVGKPFTVEKYGIGIRKGDTALRTRINDAIQAMIADGSWRRAFEHNFGHADYRMPAPPTVDRY